MSIETDSTTIDKDREDTDGYGPDIDAERLKAWHKLGTGMISGASDDIKRAEAEGDLGLRDPAEAAWLAADPEGHL